MSKLKTLSKNSIPLSPYLLIQKKRDGHSLSESEIQFFVDGVTNASFQDSQIAALLMAIYLKGLNLDETSYLTKAMMNSGKVLKFDQRSSVVDKHSSGGVGDKTSFIVGPIAAVAGIKVPMMAGRGLGHTGGTVDKAEAVVGFKSELLLDEFQKQVEKLNWCLIGQTHELAPADKKIYSLRDITATIESIPLITASIMSKKLAEGVGGLVLDIKYGNGAFMKSKGDAKKLAQSLITQAKKFKVKCLCFLTDMNQPLGQEVGHSLEILECLEILKGEKNLSPQSEKLKKISLHLAGAMIFLGGKAQSLKKGIELAEEILADINQPAYKKFCEVFKAQGGLISDLKPVASEKLNIKASKSCYILEINAQKIGFELIKLGGGREKSSDIIDHQVGFSFLKNVGDKVKKGDTLVIIHHHPHQLNLAQSIGDRIIQEHIRLSYKKVLPLPLLGGSVS